MKQFFRSTLFVLLSAFSLSACAPTSSRLTGDPESPYPLENPQVGDLFHLASGHRISLEQMLEAIGSTRVVFVGETHDNPAAHQLQLDVLEGLWRRNPEHLALAMEMFTPEQQPVLDQWSAGELAEADFLRQVGWFDNWQMNFALYRPLLDFCRRNNIPVIALNAPKTLVRKVGRTPIEELSAEDQALLPEFDFSDPYQRAMTASIYGGHSMGQARNEGFLRVQTLWDEIMAENLADYLQSPAGQERQVVVAAGGNHVRYGFGIPRRLHRRLPVSYLLIGSREIEIPAGREVQTMDVEVPAFPMRPYDYLKLTRYDEEPSGVKLGVGIEPTERGLRVTMVMPDSAAAKAGIVKGDILRQTDHRLLTERFDLLYHLMNMHKDEKLQLTLERDQETLTLEVVFQ
jgi:uncharacterized iron-regulated protein